MILENDPVITICIPTYNRGEILLKNLKKIISQNEERFPILILENFSEKTIYYDEIEEIASKSLNLTFKRNEKNILFEGSLLKFFDLVDTAYMYIISDEDVPNFTFLEYYNKILFNNRVIGCVRPSIGPLDGRTRLNSYVYKTKSYHPSLEAISEFATVGNYISGQIYNVDLSQELGIHDRLRTNISAQKSYPHLYLNMLFASQSITVFTEAIGVYEDTPSTDTDIVTKDYYGVYSFGSRIDQFLALRDALFECAVYLDPDGYCDDDMMHAYLKLVSKFLFLISRPNRLSYENKELSIEQLLNSFWIFAKSASSEKEFYLKNEKYMEEIIQKMITKLL